MNNKLWWKQQPSEPSTYHIFMDGVECIWKDGYWVPKYPLATNRDTYIPSLTQLEADKLASVMGGAQTNDFIETHILSKIKVNTQLPGGVPIPDADYLELEPGTIYYHYEKTRVNKDSTWRKDTLDRVWEVQVARAKVLRLSSPPPLPQPSSRWETPVQHLPWVEMRPTPSRRKSVAKPPIECQEAWDTLHSYFQTVP